MEIFCGRNISNIWTISSNISNTPELPSNISSISKISSNISSISKISSNISNICISFWIACNPIIFKKSQQIQHYRFRVKSNGSQQPCFIKSVWGSEDHRVKHTIRREGRETPSFSEDDAYWARGNAGEEALSFEHPGCCCYLNGQRLVSSPTQYAWRITAQWIDDFVTLLSFLRTKFSLELSSSLANLVVQILTDKKDFRQIL